MQHQRGEMAPIGGCALGSGRSGEGDPKLLTISPALQVNTKGNWSMMTTLCTRFPTALIALLATGLLVVENAHAQGSVDSDFITLVTLYATTDGASWTYDDNWVSLEHPLGEWHGVTTDSSGRVTELRLGGNQLMGEIPSELGNLDALTGLYLDQNQLTGAIPSELGNLSNLQNLYLYQNELTGAIPSELGDLSNLQELYLYQNQLTGAIPSELGDLSNLQFLNLDRNQLTGAIPSELGNLSNLQFLNLFTNELSGAIPSELGNLSNLQRLLLYENELTGAIPSELGNLRNLLTLYLFRNELSGAIPSELGNLSNLQRLHLYENELTGAIPSELGKLSNLLTLYLGDNELTGEIPPELGNLVSLTGLSLARNQLTGAIPSELGKLSNLQNLYLFSNEGLCVPPGSQLHTRLATIDFRGSVCAPPTVTSVVVASTPQSGDTYRLYETMLFTVSFSEPVELKPHGRLRLEVSLDDPDGVFGRTVEAVFSRITRSQYPTDDTPQIRRARHMHFEYKVQLFDRAEIGVSIGANALRLASGAQIRNEVGGAARLDHFAVGPLSDHKVDGSADVPMIEHISVVSTPRLRSRGAREADTYGEGENIRIGVRFDQPVHVEGEPTMALEVGDPCVSVCEARYESGSGTDTLVFAYLVLANEIDRNGIAISTNPIKVVYGDSIRNDADQEAHLSYSRTGTASGHKVDGSRSAPSHLSVEDAEAHEADRKMDFTVRLEPHGLGIVTVDYATRDGSGDTGAVAGEDYTETSGTLRFNSLEMERTVSVPIIDDAHEDDGETFTLRLSNPEGAALRSGEREATGTIRNSDPEGAPLTASFVDVPSEHDGASAFTLRIAFSEPLSWMNGRRLREDVVAVAGGRATTASRVNRRRDLWRLTVEPDSLADVTVTLAAGAACDSPAAVCTKDGRALSNTISTTVAGPDRAPANAPAEGAPTIAGTPRVDEMLSASTSGITDADGLDDARFAYQWIRANSDIQGVTGSTYTAVEADEGERLKVRVSFTDDAGNAESLTSAATDAVAARPEPLTASFEDVPVAHDGESAFTLRIASSDRLSMMNGRRLREDVVAVAGGRATSAGRVNRRRDLWRLTVEPDSPADVTVTLAAGAACDSPAAVCTKDGRALSNTISATVRGPVGIAVADARVEEGAGAVLAFAVTLSRAASGTLTVDYATSDGTATAGTDYTSTSGTLTFTAGESSKTIEVTVLDDSHDEGEETLTLRLSNASGGRLTDGKATGTIENRDPLPKAFMARFGRTAAVHVVEQVQERIEARREVGFEAQFAGRQLRPGMGREMAVEFLSRLAPSVGANRVGAGVHHPRSVSPAAAPGTLGTAGLAGGAPMGTADELLGGANPMGSMPGTDGGLNQRGHLGMGLGGGNLLTGSAFVMNHETRRGGVLSFWSRGAQSRFAGRDGDLSLDGRVRTTMFGADYAKGPLVTGLSLSHSRGLGGYTGVDVGEVTSSVTGLYPWLGYKVTDRITLWGVTGYGKGALSLTPGAGTALRSGLSMALAAGGMRGELADSVVGGFGLAFKADALWVGTGIEGVDGPQGRLAATSAAVTRYRTALEASRGYSFKRGLSLQPSLEVGVRRDGGDAENGAGVDVGGGLIVSDAVTGLSADIRVRMLLAHQDEGFRDRGMSVSFSYNPTPSTPLGFVAKLTPSWGGQATSGARALWGQETMAGMAHGGMASGNRLEAELGYGLPVGSRLVGTPRFGIGTSEYGRDYRLGYGLTVLQRGSMSFELGIEGTRRESSMQGVTDHGALARLTASW